MNKLNRIGLLAVAVAAALLALADGTGKGKKWSAWSVAARSSR